MDVSEIEFGSLLSYSVRGTSKRAKESESAMRNLKNDSVLNSGILTSEYVAQALKKEIKKYPFRDFFNSDAILVPHAKKLIADTWNALGTRTCINGISQ